MKTQSFGQVLGVGSDGGALLLAAHARHRSDNSFIWSCAINKYGGLHSGMPPSVCSTSAVCVYLVVLQLKLTLNSIQLIICPHECQVLFIVSVSGVLLSAGHHRAAWHANMPFECLCRFHVNSKLNSAFSLDMSCKRTRRSHTNHKHAIQSHTPITHTHTHTYRTFHHTLTTHTHWGMSTQEVLL